MQHGQNVRLTAAEINDAIAEYVRANKCPEQHPVAFNKTARVTITLTAGAGVTTSGSLVVAIATAVDYVVSFNSPNSVTLTRVASYTAGA